MVKRSSLEELTEAKDKQHEALQKLIESAMVLAEERYYYSPSFEEDATNFCREAGWSPPA